MKTSLEKEWLKTDGILLKNSFQPPDFYGQTHTNDTGPYSLYIRLIIEKVTIVLSIAYPKNTRFRGRDRDRSNAVSNSK
jgi:hypothetical protein